MNKISLILGGLAVGVGLLVVAGCAPSTSEPTAKIGGMAPAEYREKAELSREVPAQAKGRVR
jgi:hypothetical protein